VTRSVSARRLLASTAGASALVALSLTAPAAADEHLDVVAHGLDNPRHLAFAPTGDLFVAESGRGGDGPCIEGPEGGTVCFGASGAITRVTPDGAQTRVLTGLPSVADEGTGEGASGPTDVVATGSQKLAFTVGLGADPDLRLSVPEAADMGKLWETTWRNGRLTELADIAQHEADANPVAGPDSNPGGLLRRGSTYVVADAGGNTVVEARRQGSMTTLAVLPSQLAEAPPFLGLPPGTLIPTEAVPTAVAEGPDGAVYVSQLTGFPFQEGLANIYRVDPDGSLDVYAGGLTTVTDLAFAEDGTLYVVELASAGLLNGPVGALVEIPPGGGDDHTTVVDGLFAPYGVALQGDTAYVTTGSVLPGGGQVVAVPLD
jgi:sugar lactone lactonase YvrE